MNNAKAPPHQRHIWTVSKYAPHMLHSISLVVLCVFSSFLLCPSFLPMDTLMRGQQGTQGQSVPQPWAQHEGRTVWDTDPHPGTGNYSQSRKTKF